MASASASHRDASKDCPHSPLVGEATKALRDRGMGDVGLKLAHTHIHGTLVTDLHKMDLCNKTIHSLATTMKNATSKMDAHLSRIVDERTADIRAILEQLRSELATQRAEFERTLTDQRAEGESRLTDQRSEFERKLLEQRATLQAEHRRDIMMLRDPIARRSIAVEVEQRVFTLLKDADVVIPDKANLGTLLLDATTHDRVIAALNSVTGWGLSGAEAHETYLSVCRTLRNLKSPGNKAAHPVVPEFSKAALLAIFRRNHLGRFPQEESDIVEMFVTLRSRGVPRASDDPHFPRPVPTAAEIALAKREFFVEGIE